jgi:hypothetical protein
MFESSDSFEDLAQPDLAPLRAVAERAEIAEAIRELRSAFGYPLSDSDPLAPLARDIVRSLTEAGFTLHHCLRSARPAAPARRRVPGADPGRVLHRPQRDRGVLDDARPAGEGLGPVRGLPRHRRDDERGAGQGAARLRVLGDRARHRRFVAR